MPDDDWKPTVPERPSSRDAKAREPEAERSPSIASQRYVGGEEIARGGMGRVIEATDTLLARTVAVKEALTSDPETLRRFARETRITARLEHPSIVPVYDAGTDPSAPFYVMRRVTGRPLSGLIAAATSLDDRLALIPHVLACAQAIAHAHKRGVIHRDIKPNNILVGELGETVVIDWGIAKVIGESDPDDELPPMAGDSMRTRIGTVSGTPGFMSPEQARGDELGPSADVWALGATLYYLLARQMPHEVHAKTPDDLLAHAAYRHVPPLASVIAGVPPDLAAITERALAFEVADRFPDAATFAEELSRFLTGQIVASHRYSVRERIVRWVKRYRAAVAIAAIAITVVAVVSTVAIRRVLAARERADASALLAETSRAKEHAHAETELLARARAIATTHPTAAIAALDQLPATSPLVGEADAIFTTAISHGGAAWGLARNSGPLVTLEFDPTATKLLQLSQGGGLQVWDLDRRALLVEKSVDRNLYAVWVARGVLLYGQGVPQLLDITTKQMAPFGSLELQHVAVSEDGTHIAAIDAKGVAGWVDETTGVMTPLATDPKFNDVVIAGDGSWLAVTTNAELIIYDAAGTVVAHHSGERPIVAASHSKHLALVEGGRLFEMTVAPGATWEQRTSNGTVWPEYMGETLAARSPNSLFVYGEKIKEPFTISKLSGISSHMTEIGSGMVSFTGGATVRELVYFDLDRSFTISLPEALTTPKLASRRGSTRIALAGTSMVFVLDLEYLLPRRRTDIPGHKAHFVTDTRIISMADGGTWTLHDGDKHAKFDQIPLHAEILDVANGRVLFGNRFMDVSAIYVLDTNRMQIWTAKSQGGRLLDGGVLYVADNKLYIRPDDQTEGHEIADLSIPKALIADEDSHFYVFSNGEMLRGDVKAGVVERKPYKMPEQGVLVAIHGRLLVVDDKEFRWDTLDGPLLATAEASVTSVYAVRDGVLVTLESGVTMFAAISADGAITLHHLASATMTADDSGRMVVPTSSGTEIIEIPSRRRWMHPIKDPVANGLSLSPNGTSLLEYGLDASWWQWTLPPRGPTIDAIRHTATNAREQDDRVLLWPWQTTR